jgi:hypothetical protein
VRKEPSLGNRVRFDPDSLVVVIDAKSTLLPAVILFWLHLRSDLKPATLATVVSATTVGS